MYSLLSANVLSRYIPELPMPVWLNKFCVVQVVLNASGVPSVGEFHGWQTKSSLTAGQLSCTSKPGFGTRFCALEKTQAERNKRVKIFFMGVRF